MSARAELDRLWRRWRPTWRRLLPHRAGREVGLRARFDLTPLDPTELRLEVPPGVVPDCAGCPDRCCRGVENLVSLRLADVARLVDLGRADLIAKKKPRFSAEDLARRPHLGPLADSHLFRTLPVLRQVGPARTCAALSPSERCTLYPDWPTTCARFPYDLAPRRGADGRLGGTVGWAPRCPARRVGDAEHQARLRAATVDAYNLRIADAVLLAHARDDLDRLGLGAYLIRPGEDPFEG